MLRKLCIGRRLTGVLLVSVLLCIAPVVQRATRVMLQGNGSALSGRTSPNVFTFAVEPLDSSLVRWISPLST